MIVQLLKVTCHSTKNPKNNPTCHNLRSYVSETEPYQLIYNDYACFEELPGRKEKKQLKKLYQLGNGEFCQCMTLQR